MRDSSSIPAPISFGISSNSIGALRYLLALLIVLHHTNCLVGLDIPLLLQVKTVVYAFFALSGFFAWKSLSRCSSGWSFIRHRLMRLLPAYWAVLVASALVLSLFSDRSPAAYFTSVDFWKYLAANGVLLNFVAPELPGVFTDHLLTVVNGSLWYVKLEVAFTFTVPLLRWVLREVRRWALTLCSRPEAPCRGQRRKSVLVWAWLGVSAAVFSSRFLWIGESQTLFLYLCHFLMFLSGLTMSYVGLKGVRLTAFRGICFLSLILLGIFVEGRDMSGCPFFDFLISALFIWIIITVFLSSGRLAFLNRNNMTYSLYLCHFPLIQLSLCMTADAVTACLISVLLLGSCTPLLYYGVERR